MVEEVEGVEPQGAKSFEDRLEEEVKDKVNENSDFFNTKQFLSWSINHMHKHH